MTTNYNTASICAITVNTIILHKNGKLSQRRTAINYARKSNHVNRNHTHTKLAPQQLETERNKQCTESQSCKKRSQTQHAALGIGAPLGTIITSILLVLYRSHHNMHLNTGRHLASSTSSTYNQNIKLFKLG